MTQEAIHLTVYRRARRLFVSPGVLSDTGFRKLNGIVSVEPGPDGLLRALEAAERQARTAAALSRAERFPPGVPHWKAAGCDTWQDFIKGTTAIAIVRDDELTELEYEVPDANGEALVSDDLALELGPATPMDEVARSVMQMFETADRQNAT